MEVKWSSSFSFPLVHYSVMAFRYELLPYIGILFYILLSILGTDGVVISLFLQTKTKRLQI